MSITKELRDYMLSNSPADYDAFSTIVGRIDEEHEREVTMACGKAVAELGSKVAREYVKLPVDADGEVIHIGDVMDTEHFGTVEVEGFVHDAVAFFNYSGQPAYICTAPAKTCHHHKPTVEDLLHEFGDKVCNSGHQWGLDAAETIEEYAERIKEVLSNE